MSYQIQMLWDDEADVWVATSDDVPGLVMESGSLDALMERIKTAVPELIALNGTRAPSYKLNFIAQRMENISAHG